ncbi:MAG TPA: crosslink repair DNA glycosylase YcaQ family protein [Chthoniobacterales bacterium]|nr:crosslink repair DNA glycosylase YcaQ family protein [Chthoniobacterales bacterium]
MPGPPLTLDELRRFAVARSLFAPTTLRRALARMGFVQADPIRAPARAQDLILRQRVKGCRAGDLERQYESLGIEEDFFVNYGYVTREVQAWMHPRAEPRVPAEGDRASAAAERKRERMLLNFVEERGAVHPREVEEHFAHGRVRNYWGGSSHATTQMLDALHYRGKLRVARREKGIRVYQTHQHGPASLNEAPQRIDALVDVVVNIYAPLPSPSLSYYVRRLRYAVPQWQEEIFPALQRARERLTRARVDGVDWYWPSDENPRKAVTPETVRLLAPFDPVVHDRTRFELFWGWVYRFEAYTPAPKRKLGYYALPLLWRDRVIGWGNLAVSVPKSNLGTRTSNLGTRGLGTPGSRELAPPTRTLNLTSDLGYVAGKPPRERAFKRELEAELERMRFFLGATGGLPLKASKDWSLGESNP